ncbi:PQQ-binding-like beta-propeller repeat protein [Streptomyces sp. NBC_00038]|uniref:outer membrane protein assembly factor BamB family protein n=1 Tax=Streptomyces sp. NBC_00038 TaxID=2903615 RepID=UPI002258D333|nr:PQQ-binding-like beta-propeller repeat protein [Streptomyces sp. NBC_00038]MCX5559451.1 PQQ-binding-like beta-propeller repeat protein [Streptomyces sp. NBC_00038]
MYEDRVLESFWGGETKGPWWRRGPATAPRLWKYPREKGNPGAPLGTWAAEGTLALARLDRVEAYGLTTGARLWTWQPPDGQVIAHVSPDAPDGVGVVLHHAAGDDATEHPHHAVADRTTEHVHLTGLDLGTGAVVWTRAQRADELGSVGADAPEVALGGGRIATVRTRGGNTPPMVRVLDARTGALQWERPLPEGWGDASVLTAEPVVVSTVGHGGPATRPAPRRLYVVSENAELAISLRRLYKEPPPNEVPPSYEEFGAHPAIVGDTIAVELVSPQPDDQEHSGSRIRAFSTTTGDLRWVWHSTYGRTVFPLAHRGYLVVLNGYGDHATVLDPADGRVVAERALPGYSFQAHLAASGDSLAVICTAPRTLQRLRVFRWK